MSSAAKFARAAALLAALALIAPAAPISASPYYYFFQDPAAAATAAPAPPPPPPAEPEAGAAQLTNQDTLKEAANRVQEHAGKLTGQGAASGQPTGELPQRMKGHLSDLMSHGSSAMRGVVDTVQPDFSNIGKDLTDVYQATRHQVSKKIEPLASRLEQTVKPLIEQAGKAVAPYVNQAKEEVPKFLHSTRERLAGVFDKLKPAASGSAVPGQEQVSQAANNVQQQMPSAQSLQEGARSASETIANSAQDAAQQAQQAAPAPSA